MYNMILALIFFTHFTAKESLIFKRIINVSAFTILQYTPPH